jgi:hypothetical protein
MGRARQTPRRRLPARCTNAVFYAPSPSLSRCPDRRGVVYTLSHNTVPLTDYMSQVPNETFKAAAHLVVTLKKRTYPNVKIILAHAGGSTPLLAARVAVLSRHMGCVLSPEDILADFKTFYFEVALSGYETNLATLEKFVGGTDRLLFGTDFPGGFSLFSPVKCVFLLLIFLRSGQ